MVRGDHVLDVTAALEAIPVRRWPLAQGDPLMLNIDKVTAAAAALLASAPRRPLASVKLLSPVANPDKYIWLYTHSSRCVFR